MLTLVPSVTMHAHNVSCKTEPELEAGVTASRLSLQGCNCNQPHSVVNSTAAWYCDCLLLLTDQQLLPFERAAVTAWRLI